MTDQTIRADLDERTLSGMLIPYGEPGRTSAGTVTAAAGSISWPAELSRVKLLFGHDRERPVGVLAELTEHDDGLRGVFRIGRGAAGDQALLEAADGLRDGLSVELDSADVRDGQLISAQLVAVAQVSVPAYSSARLAAELIDETDSPATAGDDSAGEPAATGRTEAVTESDTLPAVTAPAHIDAGRQPDRGLKAYAETVAQLVASHADPSTITAALADFKSSTDPVSGLPQYVGELWQATDTSRPLIDAFGGPKLLTRAKVTGWRWGQKLGVDSWDADKTAIPTNNVTRELVDVPAKYAAGGIDIDRVLVDLGEPGLVETVLQQAIDDFRMTTEAAFAAALVAGGTADTATSALDALLEGVARVAGNGGNPDVIFAAPDVFASMLKTSGSFPFLSGALTVSGGAVSGVRIGVAYSLPAGKLLIADSRAASYYESTVRAQALDVAKGGIDVAAYGYYAELIHDSHSIVIETVTA